MKERILRKLAALSPRGEKHSSLVLKGGALLSWGHNSWRIHSERDALRKLWPGKAKGAVMVNFRITPGGRVGMSHPCEDCWSFMREVGIKKVIFTNRDGQWEEKRVR